MRKRPMCLACLGFMLVLVLLRIAGVPLGTPFSDPKYENLSARKAGRSAGRSRCAGVRNCKKAGKPAQSGDV